MVAVADNTCEQTGCSEHGKDGGVVWRAKGTLREALLHAVGLEENEGGGGRRAGEDLLEREGEARETERGRHDMRLERRSKRWRT
eukprot:751008-Hanusia_phi.AAC.2